MTFRIIVFTATIWIVLSFLCGICEGALLSGEDGATQSTLNTLANSDFASWEFAKALGKMIMFDYPTMFEGSWAMVQWIFFLPLAIGFGVMFAGFVISHIPLIGRGT